MYVEFCFVSCRLTDCKCMFSTTSQSRFWPYIFLSSKAMGYVWIGKWIGSMVEWTVTWWFHIISPISSLSLFFNLVALKLTPLLCHTNVSTRLFVLFCMSLIIVSGYLFVPHICAIVSWGLEEDYQLFLCFTSHLGSATYCCNARLCTKRDLIPKELWYIVTPINGCLELRSFLFFLAFKKINLLSLRKKGKYPSICM